MDKESTNIDVAEPSSATKGKAALLASAKNGKAAAAAAAGGGFKRGMAIFDFLLRLAAIVATLAAASIMGTTQETLPFFTQFIQFQASYSDIPTFRFFVIAMALVGGYAVLSLPFSIVTIVRPHAVAPRLLLLIFDLGAVTLNTAAASAAAAIVFLAHNGNQNTNWLPICQQFGNFCQNVSGAVVAAFVAAVFFAFMIIISAVALKKH